MNENDVTTEEMKEFLMEVYIKYGDREFDYSLDRYKLRGIAHDFGFLLDCGGADFKLTPKAIDLIKS